MSVLNSTVGEHPLQNPCSKLTEKEIQPLVKPFLQNHAHHQPVAVIQQITAILILVSVSFRPALSQFLRHWSLFL